jgi:hypothetical protein
MFSLEGNVKRSSPRVSFSGRMKIAQQKRGLKSKALPEADPLNDTNSH